MKFDYIIVGAGSAGCVLANRLSNNSNHQILLIEAGKTDNSYTLDMPAAMLSNLQNNKFNWSFQGEPEPKLNNRILQHDRGKTLGGSSSINGMVYIRGHALDFDSWQEMGCEGWSYNDVLPYFIKMENYAGGDDNVRGVNGPVNVRRPIPSDVISRAFLKAGEESGYLMTNDINGDLQEGFGVFDSTIHKGKRWSTARAYLDSVKTNANLTILTETLVEDIKIINKKATGVNVKDKNGKIGFISAEKEVILSAGAVGTPHIMMLSGLGPKEHLQDNGISVINDLPGVGSNLNDHPDFVLKYKCIQPISLWPKTKLVPRTLAGIKWFLTHKGMCATNHFDVIGCVRSNSEVTYPDIQLCISPVAVDDQTWTPLQEHAFQIHVGLMQVFSRGHIRLNNSDPSSAPKITVNYLEDERDREALHNGIEIVRDLVKASAFKEVCGEEIFPGKLLQTKDQLDEMINAHTYSQWHLSGTAAMGTYDNPNAVVNKDGQVFGLDKLRIVDASIMPKVTNGNTNCPTIMIAEKISDVILGVTPLKKQSLTT